MKILKEMKRERLQFPITMFFKKMPAVQSAEPVPQLSTFSASSQAAATDILSTSLIDNDLD